MLGRMGLLLNLLLTLLIGFAATAAMSLFLYLAHASGLVNADMIRALGSMITKRLENSVVPGLVTHFIAGAMFAFPYAILLTLLRTDSVGIGGAVGALAGFFHGFVFSFVLIAMVAESHPIERFRKVGRSVAVVHILAHVVYGLAMGLLIQGLAVDFGLTTV